MDFFLFISNPPLYGPVFTPGREISFPIADRLFANCPPENKQSIGKLIYDLKRKFGPRRGNAENFPSESATWRKGKDKQGTSSIDVVPGFDYDDAGETDPALSVSHGG